MGNIGFMVSRSRALSLSGLVLSLGLLCAAVTGEAVPPTVKEPHAASAQTFVQSFYDWYTAAIQKDDNHAMDDALKSKHWPFSDALVAALKADEAAQAKSADEVVGLDFDPYLNAQDTCFPYTTRKVTAAGDQYRVEVFDSNCSEAHPEIPTVIAVVEKKGSSWEFVNFLYPGEPGQADSDLLSVLKQLKEEREKYPADPK